MRFYKLEPEVAGGWGADTVFTRTPGKPVVVHKLHYQFDGWLGDDILETSSCYIVTDRLRRAITEIADSGFAFADVKISTSEQFQDIYPDRDLPTFSWLKISGKAGVDDFGFSVDNCLVVSERVLTAMRKSGNLENCDITEYP